MEKGGISFIRELIASAVTSGVRKGETTASLVLFSVLSSSMIERLLVEMRDGLTIVRWVSFA